MRIVILSLLIKLIMGKQIKPGRLDPITNKVNWG